MSAKASKLRPHVKGAWCLLFAFILCTPWAAFAEHIPQIEVVSLRPFQALPAPQQPRGTLARVFTDARAAAVRIEIYLVGSTHPLGEASGFFVSAEGKVLSAYHVVAPPGFAKSSLRFAARTAAGERYPLEIIAFDAYRDLVLLQALGAQNVPRLRFARGAPQLGHKTLVIGNSRHEFLQPRVGQLRRVNAAARDSGFIEHGLELTNVLAPGDSGGPVINEAGEAIGVVSYIAMVPKAKAGAHPNAKNAPGVHPEAQDYFAYASGLRAGSALLRNLFAGHSRDLPVIGFRAGVPGIPTEYVPHSGPDLGSQPGVIVGVVQPGSPADAAGLRDAFYTTSSSSQESTLRADVIVAVAGIPTPDFASLLRVMQRKGVGAKVTLSVMRGGQLQALTLKLASKEAIFSE